MKGIIVNCLKNLVNEKFGNNKWEEILEDSGLDPTLAIHPMENIDDNTVMRVLDSTCKVLNITFEQAIDVFGEYWVNVFAPKVYQVYYRDLTSAKDFILKMNEIHKKTTRDMEGAEPPRFEYSWKGNKILIMKYKSKRGLIDLAVSLLKGVGIYFKEDIKVRKISDDEIEVVFP
jgi:hypothetical protein